MTSLRTTTTRQLQRARQLWQDPLTRNSVLLAANTVTAAFFGLIFWAVAARQYPAASVGAVAAVTSLLPLITTIAGMGLPETVIRHYAHSRDQLGLAARSGLRVAAAGLLLGAFWWAGWHDNRPLSDITGQLWLLALLAGSAATIGWGVISTAALIASRRSGTVLVETVVGGTLRVLLGVLFAPYGSAGLLLAFLLASCAASAASWVTLRLRVRPSSAADGSGHRFDRAQRRFAMTNWAASAVSLAPRSLVVSIIVWRAGTQAAAWVAVPLMVLPFLTLVPSVLGRSLFAEASAHPSRLSGLVRKATLSAVALTAAGSVFTAAVAPFVLHLFGSDYADQSTALLRLLCIAAVVACPNYMIDVALNVRGDRLGYLTTNISGVAIQLGLIAVLSSYGAAGVGIAWICGQVAYLAVAYSMYRSSPRRVGAVARSAAHSPDEQAARREAVEIDDELALLHEHEQDR